MVGCLTSYSDDLFLFKWAVLGQNKLQCGPDIMALFQMALSGLSYLFSTDTISVQVPGLCSFFNRFVYFTAEKGLRARKIGSTVALKTCLY